MSIDLGTPENPVVVNTPEDAAVVQEAFAMQALSLVSDKSPREIQQMVKDRCIAVAEKRTNNYERDLLPGEMDAIFDSVCTEVGTELLRGGAR